MVKKLQKDERGLAQVLIIALCVVILGEIGFIGYKLVKRHENLAKATTAASVVKKPAKPVTPANPCISKYHDTQLCNFESNSLAVNKTSYKATIVTTVTGSPATSITLLNDGKGNTELSGSENGGVFSEIYVGGKYYTSTGGSTSYTESTTAPSTITNPTTNMDIGVGTADLTFKKIDSEPCGSLTCLKYEVTDSATPAAIQYIWFDTTGYLLQQWEYTSGKTTVDMNIAYQAVTISAPATSTSSSSTSTSTTSTSTTATQ